MYVRLPDDRPLLVRPIRPQDKPLLDAALARLSPASSHGRFLAAKPSLSSGELAYLTEVDGSDHYALVAVRADRPHELVAAARYVRLAGDPTTAEMAMVVGDDYQRCGLGRLLAQALTEHARGHGVRRFVGLTLADNVAAQKLFASISGRLSHRREPPGLDRMVVELAA